MLMADEKKIVKMDDTFIDDQSFKFEGNDVPPKMLHLDKQDANFFFGIKECKNKEFEGVTPVVMSLAEGQQYDDRQAVISELITDTVICYVGKSQNEDGHVLVVGGAGSGKSTCIAMPTLEKWGGTIFAIDIKGELTEHWNRINDKNRPTKIFNLTKEKGVFSTYDPFQFLKEDDEINDGANLVQNVREIAHAIIPLPPDTKEPFWIQSAQHVLTAALLYGYKSGVSFLASLYSILEMPIWDLIKKINKSGVIEAQLHVNQFKEIEKPEDNRMLAGISAELSNRVMVFATDSRIMDELTPSENAIKWTDLDTHNIFLKIDEDKLGQWDGVVSMMLTQLIRSLERRMDKKYDTDGNPLILSEHGEVIHPTLLLLDEFPRLGKVDVIQNAVATLRSKGVTICLIIQSLTQLDRIYGKVSRQIIVDNCPYKAILQVTDPENQKTFSDMIGDIKVKTKSIGESKSQGTSTASNNPEDAPSYDSWGKSEGTTASKNISESWEAVIRPHEFATLTVKKEIALLTPYGFCRVDSAPWYEKEREISKPEVVIPEPRGFVMFDLGPKPDSEPAYIFNYPPID
jgi:type IV secretion system protein VirD4